MSHRTSLAGVDELKYSFEQANINTQDNTYIKNIYTCIIHCQFYLLLDNQVGEISDDDDSDKSDIVIIFYFVLSRVFLMS